MAKKTHSVRQAAATLFMGAIVAMPIVPPASPTPEPWTVTHFPTPEFSQTVRSDGEIEKTVSISLGGMPLATVRTVGTGTPEIFAIHTDQLRSTRASTNERGAIVESTDYDPFGSIVPSSQSLAPDGYSERRKFTSHELDRETDYTYAKARYLDTDAGKFLSQDPAFWNTPPALLADPQQLNSYAYARNNPLRYIDPDGKLNVVIGGTWGKEWTNWESNPEMNTFVNSVADTFGAAGGGIGSTWVEAIPELRDNKSSRQAVADRIFGRIHEYQFAPGETLNIVGHSHGGNVAALLSNMLERPIDNLVTLGTPIRSDYQFNEGNIGNHVNAYSVIDPVQWLGGGQFRGMSILLGLGGLGSCGLACAKAGFELGSYASVGEFGPARRTIEGAKNVDVTKEAGGAVLWTHSNLWQNPGVWQGVMGEK